MRIRGVLLTLTVAVFEACALAAGAGGQGPAQAIGQPFTLKEAQSVMVGANAVRVTFERVVSDSRCPVDVQCIQAGDATIALQVQPTGQTRVALTLSTRGDRGTGTVDAWDIALADLRPVPRAKTPPTREPYVATLVVTDARTR